jgi:protein involved in polysaccharide export with SLBB domain
VRRVPARAIAGAWLGFSLLFLAGPTSAQTRDRYAEDEDPAASETRGSEAQPSRTRAPAPAVVRAPELPDLLQGGPVDPNRYRLGPGDMLSLELAGRVTRQIPLVVDAEGRLNIPDAGVVQAGGRTLTDVRADVLRRLRSVYSGVRIEMRLVRLRSFKVFVAGQVAVPGVTRATGATRASEVLAGALALLPEASRRNLELRHRDGRIERVDLDAFSYLGDERGNPFLEDGDILLVPPRKERIWALGAFGRPGEYELAQGDRLSDLVQLAGGLLPGTDPRSGILYRFNGPSIADSIVIDLAAVRSGPADRLLQNGDRLYAREIPEFHRVRHVTLAGEVRFPGPYALDEGRDRISTVLARAGGLTDGSARDAIQIVRPLRDGVTRRDPELERLSRLSRSEMTEAEYQTFKTKLASQEAAFVVSYEQVVSRSSEHDVLLRDGDIVFVDRESRSVRVGGEVRRPSLVEFRPGRDADEYVELAGGFTDRASRSKMRVTRAGSNQTLLLKDAGIIRPGDFLWVPEKTERSTWSLVRDVAAIAAQVATVIIVVRNR